MSSQSDFPPKTQADSAGVPWAGRHFEANSFQGDTGQAPAQLLEAMHRFRLGSVSYADVINLLHDSRFLIPLIVHKGDTGVAPNGKIVDKTQELSMVTVAAADGRSALPIFTSTEALAAWNPQARPVPAEGARVALAAAGEDTPLIVIDPGTDGAFVVRQTAMESIATGKEWVAPWESQRVARAISQPASQFVEIRSIELESGDPTATLAGPELLVSIALIPGLDAVALREISQELSAAWQQDPVVCLNVDSVKLKFVEISQ